MHLDGKGAYDFHSVDGKLSWSGGVLRGGAPPVRVGDEYFCFFHGALDDERGHRVYPLGCYTFEAQPPFAPRRLTPDPLAWPDPAAKPEHWWPPTFYTGGSALRDGRWLIAYGASDHVSKVATFDAAGVEAALCPI